MSERDGPDLTIFPEDAPPPARKGRPNTGGLNDLTGTEWIKATKSWFVCDSRRYRRNKATEQHPARFPEEMVSQFLEFFTRREGWVLDPFCGSGATLVSCLETGRRGVGVELSGKYAEMARRRLALLDPGGQARVIQGDATGLTEPGFWAGVPMNGHWAGVPMSGYWDARAGMSGDGGVSDEGLCWAAGLPQFDFIITSPPYWNMLHRSRGGVESAQKVRAKRGLDTAYSSEDGDLGNIEGYEEFIEALGRAFDGFGRLLKPGKYLVCVVQNCRTPAGEVKPLAWDLARRISLTLSFQGERIWCQDSKPLGIWGFPTVFVPNYHHHYCLIFRKQP